MNVRQKIWVGASVLYFFVVVVTWRMYDGFLCWDKSGYCIFDARDWILSLAPLAFFLLLPYIIITFINEKLRFPPRSDMLFFTLWVAAACLFLIVFKY